VTSSVPIVVKRHRAGMSLRRHPRLEPLQVSVASGRVFDIDGAHQRSFPALNDGSLLVGSVVVVSAAADAGTCSGAGATGEIGAAARRSSAWRNAIRPALPVAGISAAYCIGGSAVMNVGVGLLAGVGFVPRGGTPMPTRTRRKTE
jgi:hypothetical protein